MNTDSNSTPKTHRELIIELLGHLHPESDLSDEETLFGLIYADYEAYASLIETHQSEVNDAELRGRNARIEDIMTSAPATDGIPQLGGANSSCSGHRTSIFDLARG